MLAHRLRRWPNISPVLGYRVVLGDTLNVGQRHRRRANINPALDQSMYWLGLKGYCPAPATLALVTRHWIGVSLYSVDTPQPTESAVQCWMIDGQSRRRCTSVELALGWRVVFAGHSVVGIMAAAWNGST